MKYPFCCLLGILTYFSAFAQQVPFSDNDKARLDSAFDVAQSVFQLPGFAVGVIKGGHMVYAKGFGRTELTRQGKKVTGTSLFHMASVSKPFVAMAVLQLADAGKIRLDAPLTAYIPYFKMSDDDRYRQVTIRQMLMHTSGFPDVKDYHWNHIPFKARDREIYIRDSISHQKLLFAPGTRFSYSNMAYDVLAEVISLVSKVTFEDYMRKNIFLPCGMQHTTFLKPETYPLLRTNGHILGKNGRIVVSPVYPYNGIHAGSSTLLSNADDMLLWLQMMLNDGKIHGRQIVSKQGIQLMTTIQHKFDEHSGMGLGLFVENQNGNPVISHSGGDIGYTTYIAMFPRNATAVVLMTNLWRYAPVDELSYLAIYIAGHQPLWKLKKPIALVIAPVLHDQGIIKARELYAVLKRDYPDDYDFGEGSLNTLAYSFVYTGQLTDALNALTLNAGLFPKSASCFQHLGEVYLLAGDKSKAINSYQRAIELDGKCETCKQALEKLKK